MWVPETVLRPRRVASVYLIRTSPAISHSSSSVHSYIKLKWSSHCVNTTTDGDSYYNDKRFVLIELDQRGLEGNIAVGRGGMPRNCRHSRHLWDFFLCITYKFVIVKTVKCSVHIVHQVIFHSLIALENNMRVLQYYRHISHVE